MSLPESDKNHFVKNKFQHKVLAVDRSRRRLKHKVVVLGGKVVNNWRAAPCVACPHVAKTWPLYMNGTLYYGAIRTTLNNMAVIVSFDVRHETFKSINIPVVYGDVWRAYKTLINYDGKVNMVEHPREGRFRMLVLEDFEKQKWSMKTYHMPESVAGIDFDIVGTFHTVDICLISRTFSDPFYLVYYNLKTNSTRNFLIEGINQELYGPELKQSTKYNVSVSFYFESFRLLET